MPRQAQRPSLYRRTAALAGEIFDHWSRDNAPRLAASLAYYTILSSAPLLVISIAVADRFFGEQAVQGQLAWEIQTLVGGVAAQAIQAILRDACRLSRIPRREKAVRTISSRAEVAIPWQRSVWIAFSVCFSRTQVSNNLTFTYVTGLNTANAETVQVLWTFTPHGAAGL